MREKDKDDEIRKTIEKFIFCEWASVYVCLLYYITLRTGQL